MALAPTPVTAGGTITLTTMAVAGTIITSIIILGLATVVVIVTYVMIVSLVLVPIAALRSLRVAARRMGGVDNAMR